MSFFEDSNRKKKKGFPSSEDTDYDGSTDEKENSALKSWGNSKKQRKGGYFSNSFGSEDEVVSDRSSLDTLKGKSRSRFQFDQYDPATTEKVSNECDTPSLQVINNQKPLDSAAQSNISMKYGSEVLQRYSYAEVATTGIHSRDNTSVAEVSEADSGPSIEKNQRHSIDHQTEQPIAASLAASLAATTLQTNKVVTPPSKFVEPIVKSWSLRPFTPFSRQSFPRSLTKQVPSTPPKLSQSSSKLITPATRRPNEDSESQKDNLSSVSLYERNSRITTSTNTSIDDRQSTTSRSEVANATLDSTELHRSSISPCDGGKSSSSSNSSSRCSDNDAAKSKANDQVNSSSSEAVELPLQHLPSNVVTPRKLIKESDPSKREGQAAVDFSCNRDVVQGCKELDEKIHQLYETMDNGKILMQRDVLQYSILSEKIAIATCKILQEDCMYSVAVNLHRLARKVSSLRSKTSMITQVAHSDCIAEQQQPAH